MKGQQRQLSRSERAQIAVVLRNNEHQAAIGDVDGLLADPPYGRLVALVQKIIINYREHEHEAEKDRSRLTQIYLRPNVTRAYCAMIDHPDIVNDMITGSPVVWTSEFVQASFAGRQIRAPFG
jgi:hypothetical protein